MTNTIELEKICSQFNFKGAFKEGVSYGEGHINDTYKLTFEENEEETVHYILQRINHLVFKETKLLMMNLENVTLYLRDMIKEEEGDDDYQVLELIRTVDNKSFYKDEGGSWWRAYVFIEDATGYTFAEDINMLYNAGKAFGKFQKMLKDYPVKSLHETIVGFHHTPKRFKRFMEVLKEDPYNRSQFCQKEIQFVMEHEPITNIILSALENQEIPYRVTHNDTKLNNVLLDNATGKGKCVIDLDTVMPGSTLYDFGDAIRSCSSTVAEDEENLELLKMDFKRFEAYTKGFLEMLKGDLTKKEIQLLPQSAIIMTLECGMRFLTDYLEGDKYFKVHKEKHNLIRAKNQFKFVKEMEINFEKMVDIVNSFC
ncbi:phosphotransferase enzyme family protein [Oceanirhabdus sp. W0125-5]|uniref:phosphotransferase enzyme family protein n=1 Tax=Oceanirhabdus sp. W0125-5 TaxID=2999116 RepID=UPI0022F2FFC3|nr:aminoglycoside phosphotransferase family protein [Oceanirhabdus sp. W0125-5]WBW98891.1 aminoglycoside phosphotransferase family protein [Oceanirhabdus sp. W0125-5]